jgi:hypothetical protein
MSTRPTPLPAAADPAADRASAPVTAAPEAGLTALLRNLDIVLAVMALPIALLLGAPVLGTLVGAGVWVVQRLIELAVARVAKTKESVKVAIGYNLGAMVGRAWLVALSILAVGIAAEREDGLAAAVFVFVAFTVYFANSLLARTFERNAPQS